MKKYIDGLWQQFANIDERTRALHTLKLRANADSEEITRSYRQLISVRHPDRGGDQETFVSIRRAYELLRQRQAA